MISKVKITYLLVVIVALFSTACSNLEQKKVDNKNDAAIELKGEVGAGGNDIVSYSVKNSAVSGSPQIWAVYKGYKWFFSSEANKKIFLASADKYLPQYQEYCPVSLSNDLEIKGKPDYHIIYKDRLYFFYSQQYADQFEKDPERFLSKASEKWKEMNSKAK